MSELVTLTFDDRTVQVPKGTGLVEAAQEAGIEIPVFCYEPRLGPPVGACRMCLVEIEGMPKLQAGCTLTAGDGMVVRTAATSRKAAEGQEATLEFILVNHPLDCPVCDKGGECPLQDLTFRYGPGATRMTFSKTTFDKPIPISPLIALDRERCILCYRCTRFSEEVAEDGQLIARNRGVQSEIATFEDEPYRSPFSGNVVELCPVGALTSTLYRFDGRPWDIQAVPTVCTGCAVGCNVTATIREGKVRRILSRNHPEIDRGWLCDKGRFTYPHLRAEDRITTPLRRGPKGLVEVTWDEALDEVETLAREARGSIVTALSGSETMELTYALGRLLRIGLDAHSAVLPEATSSALDAFRLPLSAIGEAEIVVVVGDDPVAERAPIVDLWIKEARRRGAEIVVCSPTGSVQTEPLGGATTCAELAQPRSKLGRRLRSAERAVVIWSGPGGGGGSRIAELAHALGFEDKPGCGAFHLPSTPNARGVAEAWAVAADADETNPEPIELLVVSGDEAAADPSVRALAEQARRVLALTMFHGLAAGWADVVLPATGALERDGTTMNLEGRVQRMRRAALPPCPDELAWISELAGRFGVELPPHAAGVYERLAEHLFRDLPLEDIGAHAPLPARREYEAPPPATSPSPTPLAAAGTEHFVGELRLQRYRPLFSGPAVERVPELEFLRPEPEVELSAPDADRRGIETGDSVLVRSNGTSVELRALVSRKLVEGVARIADEHAAELHPAVEVLKAAPLRGATNGEEA
jgi:NADH-quinone oxidoreductase subunit G